MLALSELLCYAAIAVVLDRKYRRNASKSGEWTFLCSFLNALRKIVDFFFLQLRLAQQQVQLLVLFRLALGNLHLSLICYNYLSILLSISILLVGRVH